MHGTDKDDRSCSLTWFHKGVKKDGHIQMAHGHGTDADDNGSITHSLTNFKKGVHFCREFLSQFAWLTCHAYIMLSFILSVFLFVYLLTHFYKCCLAFFLFVHFSRAGCIFSCCRRECVKERIKIPKRWRDVEHEIMLYINTTRLCSTLKWYNIVVKLAFLYTDYRLLSFNDGRNLPCCHLTQG